MTNSGSPSTLCSAFQATAARVPDAIAVRTPDDRVRVSWREYADRVRGIATGLAALGIGRSDTVGIMLTNRPEFHLVDTAALHAGATPFGVTRSTPPFSNSTFSRLRVSYQSLEISTRLQPMRESGVAFARRSGRSPRACSRSRSATLCMTPMSQSEPVNP